MIPKLAEVEMCLNRDLVDPNFNSYKLNLDTLPVRKSTVNGPGHVLPSQEMFSYLHAKLFGEHNHLVLDPFNIESVYFISKMGGVHAVLGDEDPVEVWTLPVNGKQQSYNFGLAFPSAELALVSDGCGTLYIVETAKRSEKKTWKSVFQDEVCGKNRPFVVRYGTLEPESQELEVILQYVEEKEKLEEKHLLPDTLVGDTSFLNCVEWLSLSRGGSGWTLDRVRRIVSQGGFNYISMTGSNLALSSEKKTYVTFDSMHPADHVDINLDAEKEAKSSEEEEEEKPSFYWRQTPEDLELWLFVAPDTNRKSVKVEIANREVVMSVAGMVMVRGELFQSVEPDSWTWTLDKGRLAVLLSKTSPGPWASVWEGGRGPKGHEVAEDTEDVLLPQLTTENPLAGGDPAGEPAFNSQELESVDDCLEENSILVWQSDPTNQHVANLGGHQHLLVVPRPSPHQPALCVRHDVDGFVWEIEDCKMKHIATFPALGYVQASKQQRKFLAAPHCCSYSAICDASRHVYIYRQPRPLSEGSSLKNRKTGVKVETIAVQQVVTLENSEEIQGLAATTQLLFVATAHTLYRIAVGGNSPPAP